MDVLAAAEGRTREAHGEHLRTGAESECVPANHPRSMLGVVTPTGRAHA